MSADFAQSLRLIAITDDEILAGRDLVDACESAVKGGATMVQLRLKRATARQLADLARGLIERVSVPVIINDRVDVALGVGAAGVHLGADDLPLDRVRAMTPAGFIVGASVGSQEEADGAQPADYWGIGPWRVTTTKRDAGAALGEAGFAELARRSRGKPCVAIGGALPNDAAAVVRAGGSGIAVISGIFGFADVEAASRAYREAWRAASPSW